MPDVAAELTSSQLRDALAPAGEPAACHRSAEVNRQLKEVPGLLGTDTVLIGEVRRSGGRPFVGAQDRGRVAGHQPSPAGRLRAV